MISIVICSRNSRIEDTLTSNIKDTIGDIEYEIIIIDNSHNLYSIFSAYNIGLKSSKYPIVCFMHEDIEYRTSNWGNIVLECFKDRKVGLCGVIGSKYISQVPCGWWLSKSRRGRIIEKREECDIIENFGGNSKEQVATVDGVWFCIRKELFPKISFDTKTFNGFHCYDMDISLQIQKSGYKLLILPNIEIYHKSHGYTNDSFYFNSLLLYKKWKKNIPFYVDINDDEIKNNSSFVNSYINGISKENYFYRYTNSFVFKFIYYIENISRLDLKSIYYWTFFKGFNFYALISKNKYFNNIL